MRMLLRLVGKLMGVDPRATASGLPLAKRRPQPKKRAHQVMPRRDPAWWDKVRQRGFHVADIIVGINCIISLFAHPDTTFLKPWSWEYFWQIVGPASAVLYMIIIGSITLSRGVKDRRSRIGRSS